MFLILIIIKWLLNHRESVVELNSYKAHCDVCTHTTTTTHTLFVKVKLIFIFVIILIIIIVISRGRLSRQT